MMCILFHLNTKFLSVLNAIEANFIMSAHGTSTAKDLGWLRYHPGTRPREDIQDIKNIIYNPIILGACLILKYFFYFI